MQSPFPGMDPYIEAHGFLWEDFHDRLVIEIGNALEQAAPENYVVRVGERAYVVLAESEGKEEHLFQTDVGITTPSSRTDAPGSDASVAVAEPATDTEVVTLRAFVATEYRETFIEIYELQPERRLVTSIEVLSPSNKRQGSEGWDLYLRKRQDLLLGAANLVEIDLLRGGQRLPMLDPWPSSPYTLLVARRERSPYCRVWLAYYQRRLPIIPVPLTKPDPDLQLDLQPMIETIYARSRYGHDIDYAKPLKPPLTDAETAWLQEQLRVRQTAS